MEAAELLSRMSKWRLPLLSPQTGVPIITTVRHSKSQFQKKKGQEKSTPKNTLASPLTTGKCQM